MTGNPSRRWWPSVALVWLALGASCSGAAQPGPSSPVAPAVLTAAPARGVFSAVRGTTGRVRSVSLSNAGPGEVRVTSLGVSGADAAAFVPSGWPAVPFVLAAGARLDLPLRFVPGTRTGVLQAALQVGTDAGAGPDVPLAGLSTAGEGGENEPPLALVLRALGYGTDVGSPNLILGTGAAPLGQEVRVPLFRRAGPGPVTLRPLARYSPDDLLTFGLFTLQGERPVLLPVGVIARHQEQTLLPDLDSGGEPADPGTEVFGVYTAPNSYSATADYSLDRLNLGPTTHAVRVYPALRPDGTPLPGFLLTFEAASNGDYQDYVFLLDGAEAASAP